MAEYALILALMVLACVVGFTALGPSIRDRIAAFSNEAYN
ncbi:MAG: Flp family type IVb pilin [Bacillota bacterium]